MKSNLLPSESVYAQLRDKYARKALEMFASNIGDRAEYDEVTADRALKILETASEEGDYWAHLSTLHVLTPYQDMSAEALYEAVMDAADVFMQLDPAYTDERFQQPRGVPADADVVLDLTDVLPSVTTVRVIRTGSGDPIADHHGARAYALPATAEAERVAKLVLQLAELYAPALFEQLDAFQDDPLAYITERLERPYAELFFGTDDDDFAIEVFKTARAEQYDFYKRDSDY